MLLSPKNYAYDSNIFIELSLKGALESVHFGYTTTYEDKEKMYIL